MSDRISLSELTAKLSDPDIPQQDLARYFKVVPNPDKPFSPIVVVDPMLVEVGTTAEAAQVQDSVIQAAVIRRQRLYRRKIDGGWQGPRFVAEGDSWFQYPGIPVLVDGSDVIDFLFDANAIFCTSFAGDTLHNMLTELDKLEGYIAAENAAALLFSAGGNDLVGRDEVDGNEVGLGRFVRGYSASEPDRQPAEYVKSRYSLFLDEIVNDYRKMIDRLLGRFPDLKIFYHGYDRAFPRWRGTWLYPALNEKEVPEEHWHGVIGVLIDRLNESLIALAHEYPDRVYHVECRGVIGDKGEWRDELHGKEAGCRRAATSFQAAIDRAFAPVS